eukprot:gene11929-15964_t
MEHKNKCDIFLEKLCGIEIPPIVTVEDYDLNSISQSLKTSLTWNEVFNHIKSKHWHCEGNCRSPHQESLFTHLLNCGQICYDIAIQMQKPNPQKYFLIGLLHDLGKPGTFEIVGNYTSFKGHGLVGGAVILSLCSDELLTIFQLNEQDWSDISTAADVHMCGYFPEISCEEGSIHMDCFRLLSNGTRDLLSVLRQADCLSLEPIAEYKSKHVASLELLKQTQELFERNLMNPILIEEFCANHNLNKGVLIQLKGASAAGKSTLAKKIKSYLTSPHSNYFSIPFDKVHIISRDDYMVKISLELMGKPVQYNIDGSVIFDSDLYRSCHEYYTSNNKYYAQSINSAMMSDIQAALTSNSIVIVDTLALFYASSASQMIPMCAIQSFRINLWIYRTNIITEEESINRLGLDLNTQLKLSGKRNLFNPFLKGINWRQLVSITEDVGVGYNEANIHLRSHIAISYTWNQIKDFELYHLLNHVTKLFAHNQNMILSHQYSPLSIMSTLKQVPLLEDTTHLSLPELLHILYNINKTDSIREFFLSHHYIISQPLKNTCYENNVFGLKYIDGINQIWKPKWSREARGRFYFIQETVTSNDKVSNFNKPEIRVFTLKSALQRGVELLTKAHLDANIFETQDCNSIQTVPVTKDNNNNKSSQKNTGVVMTNSLLSNKNDKLDPVQQSIMSLFMNENMPIRGYLSGKVDGSLLLITIYPMKSPQYAIMKSLIESIEASLDTNTHEGIDNNHDDNNNAINDKKNSYKKLLYFDSGIDEIGLIVPATQGTLFMGYEMWDYFLTSLYSSLDFPSIHPKTPPYQAWLDIKDRFSQWMNDQYHAVMSSIIDLNPNNNNFNNNNVCITFSYEMICANRMTYLMNIHTELAVGYDHSAIYLLGILYNNEYIPHFLLKKSEAVVTHPVSRLVTSTSQVFEIMMSLREVVLGNIDKISFMKQHFPDQNIYYPLHVEGFVYLHELSNNNDNNNISSIEIELSKISIKDNNNHSNHRDHSTDYYYNDTNLALPTVSYDYSKIKLPIYYDCHKVRDNNINLLLSLPKSAELYFPILKQLKDFYGSLKPKLIKYVTVVCIAIQKQLFQKNREESSFYKLLNAKARVRYNTYLDEMNINYDEYNHNNTNNNSDCGMIILHKGNIDVKDVEVIYKMILNACHAAMQTIYRQEFMNLYGDTQDNNQDVNNGRIGYSDARYDIILAALCDFSLKLLMKVHPWIPGTVIENEIDELINSKDDLLKGLYNLLVVTDGD